MPSLWPLACLPIYPIAYLIARRWPRRPQSRSDATTIATEVLIVAIALVTLYTF